MILVKQHNLRQLKTMIIRHRNPTVFTFFCIAVTFFLASGCAGLSPSFEEPKVSLADIQIREVKTLETSFLVQLRIMNPNDSPLNIDGISCDVELDGRKFATGVQGKQETIPAYGSALVPMEVYASVLEMFSSVIGIIQRANEPNTQLEAMNYKLTGKVRINNGGFSSNVPFESKGELTL